MRFFYLLFFISVCFASEKIRFSESNIDQRHVLFLIHANEIEKGIDKYLKICIDQNKPDFDTLQTICLILLQNGANSKDSESQLLALFGAGTASSSKSLDILEKGLLSSDPQVQMTALHFLGQFPEDRIDNLLIRAMGSEFLPIRMEAAYLLAQRRHPQAVGQIQTLMGKLPYFFKPYFPPLFAISGTKEAIHVLKKLIFDPNPYVRIQAISSAATLQRDDLLPLIRKCIAHPNIAEQEASAFALSVLQDSDSIASLQRLTRSVDEQVRLSAYKALYLLGDHSYATSILKLAKQKNLFAIEALSEIPNSEDLLYELCLDKNIQVRVNAVISLLKRKDPRCIPYLKEILIKDSKDIAFQIQHSMGRSLRAIKVISSAKQRLKDPFIDLSLSLSLKEHFLRETLELDPLHFLKVARMILDQRQNDLVPLLMSLLENVQTKEVISFLKHYAQKAGAPFIRDYCNLALFRLDEGKEYELYIRAWLKRQNHLNIIQLKPVLPWNIRPKDHYTLDPDEASKLLIDIYLTLAAKQDEKSIYAVLEALKKGNPKNRYVLAGLLIRALSD